MSDNSPIIAGNKTEDKSFNAYTENNVHFIEIPSQTQSSQVTFTIRYSTKPTETETKAEEEEEPDEDLNAVSEAIVDEINKNVPRTSNESLLEATVVMISVVTSTVMMMAAKKKNIPVEYLEWTEKFLMKCKDRNGDRPPNIQRILDILQKDFNYEFSKEPNCPCPSFFYKKT